MSKNMGDKLALDDCIRLATYTMGRLDGGHSDYVIEEFRGCLGIFRSPQEREAGHFTPICNLYGEGPYSKEKYIGNYGTYWTKLVPIWMNIPKASK